MAVFVNTFLPLVGTKELSILKTGQLLNLLKHRDESLHESASAVLAERIVSPTCMKNGTTCVILVVSILRFS